LEAEARAAREATRKKAEEDAKAARQAARKRAEDKKAAEEEAARKRMRVRLRDIGVSVSDHDAILNAPCVIHTPNATHSQSTPTSPGRVRRRTALYQGELRGTENSQLGEASPVHLKTSNKPLTEKELLSALQTWGVPVGRRPGSRTARGSFANLRDESVNLEDYSRDLPQFAKEWGIGLANKEKYDVAQQLQRTVKRIQQALGRLLEELQGAKDTVRMKRAAAALEKHRDSMRDICDEIGRLDEDRMTALEQEIEEALVNHEKTETTETVRTSAASSGTASSGSVKLPRINIVQFHGKPQEYVSWAAQVKAHVLEQDLAPVAKFVYLERSAQGDVKTLVKRYQTTPTAESLDKCLEEIRARYGNPKLRLRAAADRFQRKDGRPTYKESRRLLDSIRASLTEIYDMPEFKGEDQDYNRGLRYLLTLRAQDLVPADVLTKWTSERGDDLTHDLDGFLDFADHIINAQIGQVGMDAKATTKDKDNKRGQGTGTTTRGASGGAGTSTALHAQATTSKEGDDKAKSNNDGTKKKTYFCIFCAKEDLDHHMATCPRAKKAHPNERKKKFDAHEGRKCEICLHAGHTTSKCFQRRKRNEDSPPFCSKCYGEHHVFIHAPSS